MSRSVSTPKLVRNGVTSGIAIRRSSTRSMRIGADGAVASAHDAGLDHVLALLGESDDPVTTFERASERRAGVAAPAADGGRIGSAQGHDVVGVGTSVRSPPTRCAGHRGRRR